MQDASHFPRQQDKESEEFLQKTLLNYSSKLANEPNYKAAKGILKTSTELSSKYERKLLCEFESSFRTNLEYTLWKNCFYTPLEALKKQVAGGAPPHSIVFTKHLSEFINQGIVFYADLLKKYEDKFGHFYSGVYQWPLESRISLEELEDCAIKKQSQQIFNNKNVLRSAQRILIHLADLHRYKVQNQIGDQKNDYSIARSYYVQAHLLEVTNGHPLNQLAVIASYEKKWIDVLFYYVRSLSVRLPFQTAHESLEIALNTLREPAIAYEDWIMKRMEEALGIGNEKKATPTGNMKNYVKGPFADIFHHKKENQQGSTYQEWWIHPANSQKPLDDAKNALQTNTGMIQELFVGSREQGRSVQKKALVHLLHCAGILITNIGADQFTGNSQMLALDELEAFIFTNESILSPAKVLKVILLFTFPMHYSKSGASKAIVEGQRRSTLKMLLAILERLLSIVFSELDQIELYLLTGRLTKKFLRSLPSICFLLVWLKENSTCLLEIDPPSTGQHLQLWDLFAKLSNKLMNLQTQGELVGCSIRPFGEDNEDQVGVILPDFFLLSPYFNVYPNQPNVIYLADNNGCEHINLAEKDSKFLSVQARFALILHIAEEFAEKESLFFFGKDSAGSFRVVCDMPDEQKNETDGHQRQKFERISTKSDEDAEGLLDLSNSSMTIYSIDEEHELKKQLLCEEKITVAHRWLVVVEPKYLVPDTNTFIDHIEQIQLLVGTKLFVMLVPTIVIEELSSLTLGVPITGSTLLSREMLNPEGSQSAYLMKKAKIAMEWLRDVSDRRVKEVKTVTSNGNILQKLSFAIENAKVEEKRSNDDRILLACVNLCKNLAKSGSKHSFESARGETTLKRTVVLLTEDRGLSIKAVAERIPVRRIPHFAEWLTNKKKGNVEKK